jgi:hypothetical protein
MRVQGFAIVTGLQNVIKNGRNELIRPSFAVSKH